MDTGLQQLLEPHQENEAVGSHIVADIPPGDAGAEFRSLLQFREDVPQKPLGQRGGAGHDIGDNRLLVRPAVALLPLGGGSGTGCARHLPGGELVAADLAEDVAGRVMGGAPGAENGGLGGGRVWIGGLGGPLLAVAVPVLVDTMSQAVVTRPVVRGAAIRADDDVILLLEGFAAHRAAVTSII